MQETWYKSTMNIKVMLSNVAIRYSILLLYNDLVPKDVQEKRTEVLENKVDRM